MRNSQTWQLAIILLLALVALYVVLDVERPDWVMKMVFWQPELQRDIALRLGLDLQGGLQVLLAADVPQGQELDAASMETARRIVENPRPSSAWATVWNGTAWPFGVRTRMLSRSRSDRRSSAG